MCWPRPTSCVTSTAVPDTVDPMKTAADIDEISSLISRAQAQARAQDRPVLAVHTERVAALEPLAWLENLTRAAAHDPWLGSHINPTRMYWSRPSDNFAIAAAGAAVAFTPTGPDRFDAVDSEWSALLGSAIANEAVRGVRGAGPVLMGAAAFDSGPHGSPWESFPDTYFFVPGILVTAAGEDFRITISAAVAPGGNSDVSVETLLRLRTAAVDAARVTFETQGTDAADATVPEAVSFSTRMPTSDWREIVADAVTGIQGGAFDKVVLARSVRATAQEDLDSFSVVRELRSVFPGAFIFGCWRGQDAFVGASPERLARLDGRDVNVSSLAGTAPRGATLDEDSNLGRRLLANAKDLSEHSLVRDFVIDALSGICDDVTAPGKPTLLSLPHVHHLHTEIRARLRTGHSLFDVVERLHPTPAVGGVPRAAALEFIRAREDLDRGWYTGPIGWMDANCGEFAVALRSAVLRGPEAILFAGCGIVADSDPEQELAESELKLKSVAGAISASARREASRHFADVVEAT